MSISGQNKQKWRFRVLTGQENSSWHIEGMAPRCCILALRCYLSAAALLHYFLFLPSR